MKQHPKPGIAQVPVSVGSRFYVGRYLVTRRDRRWGRGEWVRIDQEVYPQKIGELSTDSTDQAADIAFTVLDLKTGDSVCGNLTFREACEVVNLFGRWNQQLQRRYHKERRKVFRS